jgi:hypothetical protein
VTIVWQPGDNVVHRFMRTDGTLGAHHPLRVLSDDGERLIGWLPDGTDIIGTALPDGRNPREAPLAEMFRLPRVRTHAVWHGASTLRLVNEPDWSSVWWFFDPAGTFECWYVNLELPRGRTAHTTDRVDGALDVVVYPDRTWRWKDEDEADAAVAAGRITADDLSRLRAEGERQIALAEAGAFPYDGTWCDFRPDPDWARPVLPGDADSIARLVGPDQVNQAG